MPLTSEKGTSYKVLRTVTERNDPNLVLTVLDVPRSLGSVSKQPPYGLWRVRTLPGNPPNLGKVVPGTQNGNFTIFRQSSEYGR